MNEWMITGAAQMACVIRTGQSSLPLSHYITLRVSLSPLERVIILALTDRHQLDVAQTECIKEPHDSIIRTASIR